MSALALQQQALIEALFAWPANNAMKNAAAYVMDNQAGGLNIYQTNGHALANRALQSAYPVVAQLLGDESFTDLSYALWHAHPPTCGDIAQWGQQLIAFLSASEQLQEEPYLPDVARVEWALHRCASMANSEPDLTTLALLSTHDPSQLRLRLAPGCTVVQSMWPIASIMEAHTRHTISFADVGRQLRAAVAQDAVVWRAGLRPMVRLGLADEAALLRALAQSATLAQALDGAPALDFGAWLPAAVNGALVLSVELVPSLTGTL